MHHTHPHVRRSPLFHDSTHFGSRRRSRSAIASFPPLWPFAVLSILWCGAVARGGEVPVSETAVIHQEASSPWYFGARLIVGASDEDTSFRTLPTGATGADEDSYNPQENFGGELLLGYGFTAWGLPLRAELSGGMMYRHDADMEVSGLANSYYRNDLRFWDARLSLLADVAHFEWGRFYVGAGLGAAYLEPEVYVPGLGASADHSEWKISPSAQAGIIFDDVIGRMDVELAYRFRWFGDTESGTFSNNAKLDYEDAYIHEILLGIQIPLGR